MKKSEKFILIIGAIVYLILLGIFIKMFGDNAGGSQLKVVVPWGFIGIFISFYIYREHNRVNKVKRTNRREELNIRRQELLDNVVRKNKENDTTNK